MFRRLFWNTEEKRLATLWRLILQLVIMPFMSIPFLTVFLLLGISGLQIDMVALMEVSNETSLTFLLTILGSVFLAGYFFDRRKFSDFGFHLSRKWWTDLVFGFLIGAGLMAIIFFGRVFLGMGHHRHATKKQYTSFLLGGILLKAADVF